LDGSGGEIASAHVVERFGTDVDLTLHSGRPTGGGGCWFGSWLGFPDQGPVGRPVVRFILADKPDVGRWRVSA